MGSRRKPLASRTLAFVIEELLSRHDALLKLRFYSASDSCKVNVAWVYLNSDCWLELKRLLSIVVSSRYIGHTLRWSQSLILQRLGLCTDR